MSTKRTICFVTNELFPFTHGGIGRLTHNLIRDSLGRDSEVDLHVLVPVDFEGTAEAFASYFQGAVTFHRASRLSGENERVSGADYPPHWAFSDTPEHATSLELMLKLKELEESGTHFDVVEFADYLGWAYCSTQEKQLGRAFARTKLAIRLHSTAGIIQWLEQTPLNMQRLALRDLERKALLDADLVIGHLEGVADDNQKFYGFSEEWRRNVRIEFPPVVEGVPAVNPVVLRERDICFVTKVQKCKRPDLFVRGAALFLQNHPEYKGQIRVACHAADPEYLASVQRLIPDALQSRFIFTGPLPGRDEMFSRSIVAITSDYESLNLTAYEAAAAGATLVLNGGCTAFGKTSPFRDGDNCYLFDGTCESLAEALAKAVRADLPNKVQYSVQVPYYEKESFRPQPSLVGAARPKVSVIITNFNLGRYLPQSLTSLAASSYDNLEVILVDDASTDSFDQQMLNVIEKQGAVEGRAIKLIRNQVNRGLPASRNIGIRKAAGEYILPLDADDRIGSRFLEIAVTALERSKQYDVVVPTTGYFRTDEELEIRQFIDYACFLGDAPNMGLVANRFSCATALMRRSLFDRFQYDERLDSYEDWSLYLRMMAEGIRFLVTNDIHFHYRRRPGSMISAMKPERHQRLVARMWETLPRPLPSSMHLDAIASLMSLHPPGDTVGEKPLRYRLADWANKVIKKSPGIHSRLRNQIEKMA